MKSPDPPKPPPVAPPVAAKSPETGAAATQAKLADRKNYDWSKTIYRRGGLSSLPDGTSPTLGKP